MKCSLGISHFLEEISSLAHSIFCLPLFLCIDHWGRLSYLSLLFFGTLHSDAYIFPFLLCFLLLFFSQLFVRPPQTTILLFCISSPWGWSWSLSPVPDGQHRNQIDHILCIQRWRSSIQSTKTRPGANCGSDQEELLIAKFRLKLNKVGRTRPFRYDLNQIPYDCTVEVTNRFKGLDLMECLKNYGWRFVIL